MAVAKHTHDIGILDARGSLEGDFISLSHLA